MGGEEKVMSCWLERKISTSEETAVQVSTKLTVLGLSPTGPSL